MGNTSDGLATWTPYSGTWGINGNQAYMPSGTAQAITSVESSVSDVDIQVVIAMYATVTNARIMGRGTDDSNYTMLSVGNPGFDTQQRIYTKESGSFNLKASSASLTLSNGDTCKYRVNGSGSGNLQGYQNGVLTVTATSSFQATATQHGLGDDTDTLAVARFGGNFTITALGGASRGLFLPPNLNGLGAGGSFFANPIG